MLVDINRSIDRSIREFYYELAVNGNTTNIRGWIAVGNHMGPATAGPQLSLVAFQGIFGI
jgi:hypothetical protein